jgi:hypothetical protein
MISNSSGNGLYRYSNTVSSGIVLYNNLEFNDNFESNQKDATI